MEEFIISVEEINDFFFTKLVSAGLVPQPGDLDIISEIVLEFLEHKGLIDIEEDYFDEDEDYGNFKR